MSKKIDMNDPNWAAELGKQSRDAADEMEKIIAKEYDGDEEAYMIDHFDMLDATLLTGYSFDEIRMILIENIHDEKRKQELMNNMHSSDLLTRTHYPGGYYMFVNDVKNGLFGDPSNILSETKS
jgi:GTP cyclohydrolase III